MEIQTIQGSGEPIVFQVRSGPRTTVTEFSTAVQRATNSLLGAPVLVERNSNSHAHLCTPGPNLNGVSIDSSQRGDLVWIRLAEGPDNLLVEGTTLANDHGVVDLGGRQLCLVDGDGHIIFRTSDWDYSDPIIESEAMDCWSIYDEGRLIFEWNRLKGGYALS